MTNSPAQAWFKEMRQIWLEKRPDDIGALLSDEGFEYFENPFHAALITKAQVIEAWQEIYDQDIEDVTIDILHDRGDISFAQW